MRRGKVGLEIQFNLVPVEILLGLAARIMRPASKAIAMRVFWISSRLIDSAMVADGLLFPISLFLISRLGVFFFSTSSARIWYRKRMIRSAVWLEREETAGVVEQGGSDRKLYTTTEGERGGRKEPGSYCGTFECYH